ncbi:MAG TPA: S8 family serine peptidase [Candidatus Binatia bacterium]|nr:S8 family serine peptidase [Candidatus Binatia bacterium]
MHFRTWLVTAVLISMSVIAWAAPARPVPEKYVEGDAIVTFKASVSLDAARRALGARSLELTKHFGFLSAKRGRHCGLVRAAQRTTADLIAELSRDPAVEAAEPNYLRWVSVRLPNDPLFPQLWALQNKGQAVNGAAGTSGDDLKFVPAWGLARPTSNQVVVAVVDSGVDYTHPDLTASMWTNPGEIPNNGIDDDGNGYVDDFFGYDFADGVSDPQDSGFHGTHVSGTIAATGNNLIGVIGVDYQARIMALKVSNDGSSIASAAEIEAIQYATMMKERGINVVAINASFSGGGSNSTEVAAIQAAGNAGIIFCAAAGNSSVNHDTTPVYPSSYRLANMIVVAATDQNDGLASFSDYGAGTVDVGAPGVNILSTEPTSFASPISTVQQGSSVFPASPMLFSGSTTGLTSAIYDCGFGFPTNFPASVSNNIALISRGTLTFAAKVANAMAAGARAAVIYNNTTGSFAGTLQFPSNWIPAVSIDQTNGQAIQATLPTTVTVVSYYDPSTIYQFLDGTSMATPHVAGAVAFAAMNIPSETVAQRIQRLLANVDAVPGLNGVVRTGGRLNLQRTVDTDGNGLPDWWEQIYFGHLTGTDPNADPDHDGASNLAEWLAGTNPTNATSCLRLALPRMAATNGFVVQWPSVAGKFYRLQRATNLLAGFNTLVQTNIAATAPTNTAVDPATSPSNARFYRIELEQ